MDTAVLTKWVRRVGQQLAVHRAIMVVDVERFGDPARTNLNQLAIREVLYSALLRPSRRVGSAGIAAWARTAVTARSSWFRRRCQRPTWPLVCQPCLPLRSVGVARGTVCQSGRGRGSRCTRERCTAMYTALPALRFNHEFRLAEAPDATTYAPARDKCHCGH